MKTPIQSGKTSNPSTIANIDRVRQPRAKQPRPFLRGGASTQVFITVGRLCQTPSIISKTCDSLHRYTVTSGPRFNVSTLQRGEAIFVCASINLSYKARKPSESTRAPPMIGMKFVSPVQRGTMWMCK